MQNGLAQQEQAVVEAAARAAATDPTELERRLAVRNRPITRLAMYQSWQELLFLHWRFEPAAVQAMLPPGPTVDTFNGEAWVGIVPFFMRRIRPWWSPSVPGISNFMELNCRTYVVDRLGTPGVWFFSLDANCRPAVWWARTFYRLPYHHADMTYDWNMISGRVDFRSHRRGTPQQLASRFVYEPRGEPAITEPGSLEFFLIERYVLFADRGEGRLMQGTVHHAPYEVSAATVEICDDSLLQLNKLGRRHRPPDHSLMSRGVNVDVFPLQPLAHR